MGHRAQGRDLAEAGEGALHARAAELQALAIEHGITDLRVAGRGRLVGHVADNRDLFDVADFETAAAELLGADVTLFSDSVLEHPTASPDLRAATPL